MRGTGVRSHHHPNRPRFDRYLRRGHVGVGMLARACWRGHVGLRMLVRAGRTASYTHPVAVGKPPGGKSLARVEVLNTRIGRAFFFPQLLSFSRPSIFLPCLTAANSRTRLRNTWVSRFCPTGAVVVSSSAQVASTGGSRRCAEAGASQVAKNDTESVSIRDAVLGQLKNQMKKRCSLRALASWGQQLSERIRGLVWRVNGRLAKS